MSALVYEAPNVMVIRELPVPVPGPGEAVVRVAYSGICGSELSGFLGASSIRTPPLVFGHEVSGHLAVLGPDVGRLESALDVGAAVTVNPLVTCGRCRYCLVGRQQLCPERLLLGASLPGSNAEYVVVPAASVLPVPVGLRLEQAALAEPVAFALHTVELSGVSPLDSALVVGAGAIGLLILQVLEQWGVRTRFVVERNPDRLALAVAAGCIPIDIGDGTVESQVRALTDSYGVGVAFDAVGTPVTRRECLASVEAGGTVVLVGLHTDATELALNAVVRSEITVTGAFAYSPTSFRTALAWLATERVGLADGVVIAPLTEGQDWFERLVKGDPAVKVLLAPSPAGRDVP